MERGGGSVRGSNGNQKRKRALNSFAGQHVWIPELFAHALYKCVCVCVFPRG